MTELITKRLGDRYGDAYDGVQWDGSEEMAKSLIDWMCNEVKSSEVDFFPPRDCDLYTFPSSIAAYHWQDGKHELMFQMFPGDWLMYSEPHGRFWAETYMEFLKHEYEVV